ncbi:CHP03435 domain-containing protein [alpha proteobacterium U9-1i]|nr:CHP03435 domain-containing protein [alpha proteobacterium U9-1i]
MAALACALALPASAQTLAEQQREDIAFLRTEYLPRERAFTPEGRANAERLLDALDARAGAMTPDQLLLGFQEVVAAADNSHSLAGFGPISAQRPTTRLPIVLAWFEDSGLVVMRALPPYQDLAGAQVLEIAGRPSADVHNHFTRYFGGPAIRRNIMAPGMITSEGMLAAAGFSNAGEPVSMRFRLRDGSEALRDIAYIPRAGIGGVWWPMRWWSPEPIADSQTPWATAIANDATLPLYLRNADAYNSARPLPELDAVYLELKSNEADREARDFARRADAVLREAQFTNIIVDLRFSKGGDMGTTAAFLDRLPTQLPQGGRIFVIVGRYTFSAGMASANILLNAAGARATLVGEDVGDRMRFWSEGDSVCAPNSNYCARYTTGLFDLAQGCDGQPRCHRDNGRFNLVGPLTPTLRAPMTWADYLAGRDPSMEAIQAALGR